MIRQTISRCSTAAACMSLCLATMCGAVAQDTKGKDRPGGHPLAGRHGGLADLLEAPDWPAATAPQAKNGPPMVRADHDHERVPQDASVPGTAEKPLPERPRVNPQPLVKPAAADPRVRSAIKGLIDQRNRIIDGCTFFDTIEEIKKGEIELGKRVAANQVAARIVNEAASSLEQVRLLGDGGKQLLPAAENHVRQAQERLRTAIDKVREQQQELVPSYVKIKQNIGPWMKTYQEMRGWLVPDRGDPNRPAVLEALEAATARREDFYEGHVLAALARAYDGDAAGAERHLTAACAGFGRYGLFGTVWGADCCLVYLLLEEPKKVADYVASVRKLDSKRQTPLLCWLVGQAAMLEGKDNEAKTYFERALSKMGFNDPKQPHLPEPLLGDAAFFYATAKNDKVCDPEKAQELLNRAPKKSDSWNVLRARAAVLAAVGDYDAAGRVLDACRERAPGTLDATLDRILNRRSEPASTSDR